jgi:hypothetical protein
VYLNSKAKQKMVTGLELLIADCTVADVNLSAKFKRFMAHVFLQMNKRLFTIYHPNQKE